MNKNNGLLSGGVGFGGWDTTPIQNNTDSNITNIDSLFENETTRNNNHNNGSKLKPYKNQQESQPTDEHPFPADSNNHADAYMNPFAFGFESPPQPQSQTHSMNGVNQVLDMLFDVNPTSTSTNDNNRKKTEAFYTFDFGTNTKEKENDNVKLRPHKTQTSSDSSSDSESESHSHSPDNTVKISPPTKQSTRTKKRRNSKTANEKAFEALDTKLFDPSLISKVPISEIHAKSKPVPPKLKKRATEPVHIHSQRQEQLVQEGLIQSPNVGSSLRNKPKAKGKTRSKKTKENNASHDEKEKEKPKQNAKSNYNVLPELHRGTALLKYGRRGYPHFRQFNLTADNEHLRWFSSKKKLQQSSINVGTINEILTGQHTKEFRRIAWTTLTPASFSIIYENKKKSLNLVAKSVDEMKMWVESLRKLRDLKRKGEALNKLDTLHVEVDFRDRNRPQSRHHSGNFLRSHETKERSVDPMLQRKLIDDIAALRKQFIEISREANNPIVQSTKEYESIEQILSELEERIEELDHEVRNTRNTKIAENDVWRTRIDLESLREKIKVINKQHKQKYNNSKRRWSVF
eukprot:73769_1